MPIFGKKSETEDDVHHSIPTCELSLLGQLVKQPFGVRDVGVRRSLDYQRKPCVECNLEFEDFLRPNYIAINLWQTKAEVDEAIDYTCRKSIQKNM